MEKRILLFICLVFVASGEPKRPRPRPTFDTYAKHTKTNGFDHRPMQQPKEDRHADLSKIRAFFEKKRTINNLQNPNIPIHEKMQIIDNEIIEINSPKDANIFAGGLMTEWEFDMDRKN